MKLIARGGRIIIDWFLNLAITKKMILGYLALVFIPTILLGSMYFRQINESGIRSYALNQQYLLEQIKGNVLENLYQVESMDRLFQLNTSVIELLSGFYQSDADQVYVYKKDIEPLIIYLQLTSPSVEKIRIYPYDRNVLNMGGFIVNLEELQNQTEISGRLQKQGYWVHTEDKSGRWIKYYQFLYSQDFYSTIGIIEITINESAVMELFLNYAIQNQKNVYFRNSAQEYLFSYDSFMLAGDTIESISSEIDHNSYSFTKSSEGRILAHSVDFSQLDMQVFMITPVHGINLPENQSRSNALWLIPLLLLVLSAIYYLIFISLTKRLLHLKRHMKKIDYNNLKLFEVSRYKDELGQLENSYNKMIKRLNEMVYKVHYAQIMQKEAAFNALQSQINPHFIYNTIETIRMMAEMEEGKKAADMCYILGKIMRYSQSTKSKEVSLQEEVNNVKNYLDIYEIRAGERFSYVYNTQLNIQSFMCPKFILQPLVENCVIHGIKNIRRLGVIKLDIYEDKDYIVVEISDNGVGIVKEDLDRLNRQLCSINLEVKESIDHQGIGISNVNERIKLFFGADSGIRIKSEQNEGTLYIIKMKKGEVKYAADDR